MNWPEVLTILVPLVGLMGWVYNRIEKKADERFRELKEEIKETKKELRGEIESTKKELKADIDKVQSGVQSLDSRVSRIEGHLTGMGHHWEPKVLEKEE